VTEESTGSDPDPTVTTVTTDAASLPQQVDAHERWLIAEALTASNGNVALTAEHLGVPKKTLYDKLKKYHLATGRAIDG
jgi:two-component system C4-dicarboxylate transport response regulator DctD